MRILNVAAAAATLIVTSHSALVGAPANVDNPLAIEIPAAESPLASRHDSDTMHHRDTSDALDEILQRDSGPFIIDTRTAPVTTVTVTVEEAHPSPSISSPETAELIPAITTEISPMGDENPTTTDAIPVVTATATATATARATATTHLSAHPLATTVLPATIVVASSGSIIGTITMEANPTPYTSQIVVHPSGGAAATISSLVYVFSDATQTLDASNQGLGDGTGRTVTAEGTRGTSLGFPSFSYQPTTSDEGPTTTQQLSTETSVSVVTAGSATSTSTKIGTGTASLHGFPEASSKDLGNSAVSAVGGRIGWAVVVAAMACLGFGMAL